MEDEHLVNMLETENKFIKCLNAQYVEEIKRLNDSLDERNRLYNAMHDTAMSISEDYRELKMKIMEKAKTQPQSAP